MQNAIMLEQVVHIVTTRLTGAQRVSYPCKQYFVQGRPLKLLSLAVSLRTTRFNRQLPLLYTSLTDWVFTTVVESVYSAVRTDSLYKADYVSSIKG